MKKKKQKRGTPDNPWFLYNYKSRHWYELKDGILLYQSDKPIGKAKDMGYFVVVYENV